MRKFKNRIAVLLLVLIALLVISGTSIFALQTSRTAYAVSMSDLSFTELSDGTYEVKAAKIGLTGDLVIPSTYNVKSVTKVGVFYGSQNAFTSVTIPDSVTEIATQAFHEMHGLKSVTFGKGLKKICNYAFSGCQIDSLVFPKGFNYIGRNAFTRNTKLNYVYLPDSVNFIGYDAFYDNGYCILEEIHYEGTSQQWEQINIEKLAIPSDISIICLGIDS